ncbi:MAG: hypothetical protein ACM37W_24260 [Actinomycetota bacterium]
MGFLPYGSGSPVVRADVGVSVSWVAEASPVSVSAPSPAEVAELAVELGGAFLLVRPSSRSFSRWVAVVFFGSESSASSFGGACVRRFELPLVLGRPAGAWWVVSVPVFVSSFRAGRGSLPCLVERLS